MTEAAERIATAIEGRDPKGYTEVCAADVAELESLVDPVNNGVPELLVKGAKRALRGVRPARAGEIKVAQRTDQLAQLLAALKADNAKPVQ